MNGSVASDKCSPALDGSGGVGELAHIGVCCWCCRSISNQRVLSNSVERALNGNQSPSISTNPAACSNICWRNVSAPNVLLRQAPASAPAHHPPPPKSAFDPTLLPQTHTSIIAWSVRVTSVPAQQPFQPHRRQLLLLRWHLQLGPFAVPLLRLPSSTLRLDPH